MHKFWLKDSRSGNRNCQNNSKEGHWTVHLAHRSGRACYISRTSKQSTPAKRLHLLLTLRNYYILLLRPKLIVNLTPDGAERDARARVAADSITRLAEDTLAAGLIDYGNIHL